MKKTLLALVVAEASLLVWPARADQPVSTNYNFQNHFVYDVGAPASSPAPATSPELHGGHTNGSFPASTSGLLSDIVCSGSNFLPQWTGSAWICTNASASLFAPVGPLTFFGNPTNGSASPSFVGPGAAGQVPIVNAAGTSLGWGFVPWTSVTGAPSSFPPSGAAGGALTGAYPNPGVNVGAGALVTGVLPLVNMAAPTGSGFPFVSGGAWGSAARTLVSPNGTLVITNADGSAGNPGIDLPFVAPAQGYCGAGTAGFEVDDNGRVLSTICATYVTPSTSLALVGQIDGVGPVVGPINTLIDQMGATTGQVLEWNGSEWAPATAATGTVTSVNGTAGQISCTNPTSTPVCSLVSTGAGAGSCTNCSVSFDALGRETTYSSGTAPVTSVTGSGGLMCSPTTGTPTCTMANQACGANTFVSSATTTGGLQCTQPAFSNLSGSLSCAQLPALTGPATTPGGSCATTLAYIPNDTPQLGDLLATAITGPSTPAAGKARIYVDSTSKNLAVINDTGTINHGIQTASPGAGFAINAIHDDGTVSAAAVQSPLTPCTDYVSISCQGVSSDLANTNANVEVNAVHDGSSVRHPITGAWTTSSMLVTDSSGGITTGSAPTLGTLSYAMSLFAILNTGEAVQGGLAPNPTGAIGLVRLEYPIGVSASNVTLHCYLATNNITSGTYTIKAARNGSDTGASLAYTSASTANVVAVNSATVTSPSSSDTWGLDITTVGFANNPCGSGACNNGDLYCTILLQP